MLLIDNQITNKIIAKKPRVNSADSKDILIALFLLKK
jgi:hypothetical protein